MRSRRKYSEEFKLEAVQLSNEPGLTVRQVAREFGIGEGVLTRWRKALRESGSVAFPGKSHGRDEELMYLKRELAR